MDRIVMTTSDHETSMSSKLWGFVFPWLRRDIYDGHIKLSSPYDIELVNSPVIIRPIKVEDYTQWYKLRADSRAHLTKWEPDWQETDVTYRAFSKRIKADLAHMRARRRFSFLIISEKSGEIAGGISLSDIKMGNRRSGMLGYWIGEKYSRQGLTRAAIEAVQYFAFDTLNLHRLEAACQPLNTPSRQLLLKSGFHQEGLAKEYLKINGKWRDHEIWALTKGRATQKN